MSRATPPVRPHRLRLRHLQPLCLALLARKPGSGYDVLAALRALPLFRDAPPDIPGVYRTLRSLEQSGFLRGRRWPPAKGPARRVLTLNPPGRAALATWRATLLDARQELDAVLALVQGAAGGAKSGKPKKQGQGSGARVKPARKQQGRR